MVKYHPQMSPRALTSVRGGDHLRNYPAHWELLRWYKCWRKFPYPSEISAFLVVQNRADGYAHYPCPYGEHHWHIGRGGNLADPRHLAQRAKRVYRKAVRDEIWAEYEERQRVEDERDEEEEQDVD